MNRKFSVLASTALVIGVVLAIAIAMGTSSAPPTQAQEDDAPVLTFSNPAQGAMINQTAFFVQLCFEKPVNILDLDKGGDFAFSITPPDDFPLGLRIVFQPGGQGLAIYPNNSDADNIEGEWTLDYRLTAPETLTPLEGTLTWTVDPDGQETPQSTPPVCTESGFTATPGAGNGNTASPVLTSTSDTGTPAPTATGGEDNGGSNPSILTLALLTIGAAGAVGLIALIAFFVRRGVGYEPHRPGPDDEPPEHH